jgi:hypothetical protein
MILTSLIIEWGLCLQALVEPAVAAVLEVEWAHVGNVTGLRSLGVIARLAIDVFDRTVPLQGETGLLPQLRYLRVARQLGAHN